MNAAPCSAQSGFFFPLAWTIDEIVLLPVALPVRLGWTLREIDQLGSARHPSVTFGMSTLILFPPKSQSSRRKSHGTSVACLSFAQ